MQYFKMFEFRKLNCFNFIVLISRTGALFLNVAYVTCIIGFSYAILFKNRTSDHGDKTAERSYRVT